MRTSETLVDAVFGSESIRPSSNWIKTTLIEAAEAMGHSNPQSLRPCLTYVLNRRIQAANATKVTKLESRLRQLKLQEGSMSIGKINRLLPPSRHTKNADNHDTLTVRRLPICRNLLFDAPAATRQPTPSHIWQLIKIHHAAIDLAGRP